MLGGAAGSGLPSWALAAKLSRLLAGKGALTSGSPKRPLPSGTASKGTGGLWLLWLVKASLTGESPLPAWGALVVASRPGPCPPSSGLSPVAPAQLLVLPAGRWLQVPSALGTTGDVGGVTASGGGKRRPKQGLAGGGLLGLLLAPGTMSRGCRKGGVMSQVPVGADVASRVFAPRGTLGRLPTVLGGGTPVLGATARCPSAENCGLRPGPVGNHGDTGVNQAPAGPGHPSPKLRWIGKAGDREDQVGGGCDRDSRGALENVGKPGGHQGDWDGWREPRRYKGDRKGLGLDRHDQDTYGVTQTRWVHSWELGGGRTG